MSFGSNVRIMYSKLMFIGCLFLLLGCQKNEDAVIAMKEREQTLLASKEVAFEKVSHFLAQQFPSEELLSIADISFIHTQSKSVALIFYQTNTGEHNLAIEQHTDDQTNSVIEKISTCHGDACACQVKVTVDNKGNVDLGCNCSSCYMVTTEG